MYVGRMKSWLLLSATLVGCVVPETVVIRGDTGGNSDISMMDSPSIDVPSMMDPDGGDEDSMGPIVDAADAADVANDVPSDIPLPACPAGQTRCSGVCTETANSPTNCGRCGNMCNSDGASAAPCNAGVCIPICMAGRADCDRDPANGCEVTVATNANNCGGCGTRCPMGANSMATCAMGGCGLACTAGFANCDDDPMTGCEADLRTTLDHCGRCGNRCAFANAATSCNNGVCALGACTIGFANCDGDGSNGCETNLNTAPLNCGMCGTRCPGGFVCTNGSCQNSCNMGLTDCAGACVNVITNAQNCGACGNACMNRPNGTGACVSSACNVACNPNFRNCDGNVVNGCEIDTRTDETNCGACGTVCPNAANATRLCSNSLCGFTCNGGFGNCDNNPANGCEVNLSNNNSNCGVCGTSCSGGRTCSGGSCVCPAGQTFCAGVGRCVNLSIDGLNCGMCGNACAAGQSCSSGNCVLNCGANETLCGASCANTMTNPSHCGGCNRQCMPGQVCNLGVCGCPPGQMACGIACLDTTTDRNNCGGCNMACPGDRNCVGSRCVCSGGRTDCGVGPCVDTTSDNLNCGACMSPCPINSTCSNSVCCGMGMTNCGGFCANRDFDNAACGPTCTPCLGAQVCSAGVCRQPPANDRCNNATPINDMVGTLTTIMVNTVGATPHAQGLSCTNGKTDVFYSFMVPMGERHLVYADTFGNMFDSVLAFAENCAMGTGSATLVNGLGPPGEVMCNDDAGTMTGCSANGLFANAATISAVLDGGFNPPGITYYVVVSGFNNSTGTTPLHFVRQRVNPVSQTTYVANTGLNSIAAVTQGQNTRAPICGGGMAATGPEQAFWWRTCPNFLATPLAATTCVAGPGFDTHLSYWSSSNGTACNDNDGACVAPNGDGNRSTFNVMQPPGAALHVVWLDGRTPPGPDRGQVNLNITR